MSDSEPTRKRPGYLIDSYLWDKILTDPDRDWILGHMELVYSMSYWVPPRDPYESARR
jgi:hypothetical protein